MRAARRMESPCTLPHPAFKYFKVTVVNHGWRVTGERQSAGRVWVAGMGLVQEALDVNGQTGGGANGVVPQNVDYII